MIDAFDIYLISQLDTFRGFCAPVGFISFVIACVLIGGYLGNIDNERNTETTNKMLKKCFNYGRAIAVLSILLITSAVFLPSTKTAVAMFAVPKIVNNEDVQEIPQNAAKLINERLKEWMNDTLEMEKKNVGN